MLNVKDQIDKAKNKIARLEGLTESSYKKLKEQLGTKDLEKAKKILKEKETELENLYNDIKKDYDEIIQEYESLSLDEED